MTAASGYQQTFPDVDLLPVGVWLFRQMASRAEQELMREELRAVAEAAPFVTPKMPGGTDFRLKLTNAGDFGWVAGGRTSFKYERTQQHPKHRGERWPAIPPTVMAVAQRAARKANRPKYVPNTCLINYYAKDGELGHHRDDTNGEDFAEPIVTISLGDKASFVIGGLEYKDNTRRVELISGDVLVMGDLARLFFHSVEKIHPGTSDLLAHGGRISATLRRVRR
jgi:alkylated DNA repair protein (DNA oxidative demethylase)